MNKKYIMLFSLIFVSALGILVIAQSSLIPPGLNQIFGPYPIITCSESDNGPNIYQQGQNTITFSTINSTINNSLELYDDFSSGFLNLNKWIETPTPGTTFTDEHYVNNLTQKYHIAQNTQSNRGTMLTFNKTFFSGDKLAYEIEFNSASGNAQHGCRINGNYCSQSGIVPNPTPTPGSGMIGYWNGLSDVGNQIGMYRITEEFNQNNITQTVIRPDNTTITHTYTSVTTPYTFRIFSHTGHNGLINTDIDNVYISTQTQSIQTYSGPDFCIDNNELAEGLCGSWIDQNFGTNIYNTSVFIPTFYCNASNNGTAQFSCINGACVTSPIIPNSTLYDNFSSGLLNLQLWNETQDPEGQPLMGKHFVNQTTQKYEVENIGTQDQRVVLNLINHTFIPGEHLEYDLNYINGSGNRIMGIFLNGGPVDRLFGSIGCYWCGSIGHNGQNTNIGNAFGLYHTKLDFLNNGVNYTVIRPNGSVYNQLIPITNWNYASNVYSSAPPWNLGFETLSNGAIHAEYDNFHIFP